MIRLVIIAFSMLIISSACSASERQENAAGVSEQNDSSHPVYSVFNPADDRNIPPLGTLRDAVSKARISGGLIRIETCDEPIRLSAPIHLPDNTTVQGSCDKPVEILGPQRGSIFYIDESKNVTLRALSLSFEGPDALQSTGDCVTIRGGADKVLISESRFRRCRDGMVDVTHVQGENSTHVVIEKNFFADHDKGFLISAPFDGNCSGERNFAITVLMRNNVMREIGQRIPRANGNVMVRLVGNDISVSPRVRRDGQRGGSYVAYADEGALIVAENNTLRNTSSRTLRGFWASEYSSNSDCPRGGLIQEYDNQIDANFINQLGESPRGVQSESTSD